MVSGEFLGASEAHQWTAGYSRVVLAGIGGFSEGTWRSPRCSRGPQWCLKKISGASGGFRHVLGSQKGVSGEPRGNLEVSGAF